ncbi:MAG: hypothetical protein M0Q93_01040, partial [Terrimicrobiaceae bacterium]|nr:hypothetical protein [Terrimicrobiaceae bacterium]
QEQARHDAVQKSQDDTARLAADASAQAAGSQATGVGSGKLGGTAAANLATPSAQTAPGLTPFGSVIQKAGNAFYTPQGIKVGGS